MRYSKYREMLAHQMENRGPLSNTHLAAQLRDPHWTPDKDSLWASILRAMSAAFDLGAEMTEAEIDAKFQLTERA